jgi:proteasome regulatory subunit
MKLDASVKKQVAKFAKDMDGMSGAEIKSVCTEAGYFAIREERSSVTADDFKKAIVKVKKEEENSSEHLKMFG